MKSEPKIQAEIIHDSNHYLCHVQPAPQEDVRYAWRTEPEDACLSSASNPSLVVRVRGPVAVSVSLTTEAGESTSLSLSLLPLAKPRHVEEAPEPEIIGPRRPVLAVGLTRAARPATSDQVLWVMIRNATNRIAFNELDEFLKALAPTHAPHNGGHPERGQPAKAVPLPGADPYAALKAAVNLFLQARCGVLDEGLFDGVDLEEEAARCDRVLHDGALESLWERYVGEDHVIPYLQIIEQHLGGAMQGDAHHVLRCHEILKEKLLHPPMVELLWSYWHEEAMLVQAFNAISLRFQNRKLGSGRDPLAGLAVDPLRPLSDLLWGHIQDEQHLLSVARRAYEYDSQYGITLRGRAVQGIRPADTRSRFLEAFHLLLARAAAFFAQDDNTTVVADSFPLLNALKEVHFVLAQGAHNQYGSLPWTARREMLVQQYILARPEMREFLGGPLMVPYRERWMDRVDTMKKLQGWSDTTVVHFSDLGKFGEQILLSVRYGAWSDVIQPQQAANWARYWRAELQGYMHAYRAVTGVDLTSPAHAERIDATPPSVLLQSRLLAQAQR